MSRSRSKSRPKSPPRRPPTEIVYDAMNAIKNNTYSKLVTSGKGITVLFVALLIIGLLQTGMSWKDAKKWAINTLSNSVLFEYLPEFVQHYIKPPLLTQTTINTINSTMSVVIIGILTYITSTLGMFLNKLDGLDGRVTTQLRGINERIDPIYLRLNNSSNNRPSKQKLTVEKDLMNTPLEN